MNKRSYVISGLIILGVVYSMAIGPGGGPGGTIRSGMGRIAVLADDSPIYSDAPFEITNEQTTEGDMQWSRTYGGTINAMIQMADGGFALAGFTPHSGVGKGDFWLVKTDAHGEMQWQQTYDGAKREEANAMIQTADGGFALAGFTFSYGAGDRDGWLVKTDAHGTMEWQQTYGGADWDGANAVIQTADGGFALAGYFYNVTKDTSDFWLVKTDAHGEMQWHRIYGGADWDGANAVIQTADGGFALAGVTMSYGAGGDDLWLVKTDAYGTMEWQQTYGGSRSDEAWAMIQTADGGFALAGVTMSYGAGGKDFWLVKTDAHGTMQWQQTYGSAECDKANAVIQTSDGGFALVGYTFSYGAGDDDFWLVKTDAHGTMQWQQTYGGAECDRANTVIQTSDGSFVLAGSKDYDSWLVKTIPPDITPPALSVPTKSEKGRIVVLADDWPLSDRYWSTSASTFALNAFGWLTEFSSGKRILRDDYSDPPIKNNLVDTLQTNGYTVTIMDTTSWTPALLATYDAVLIEYCSINNTLLTEYVTGGGAIFIIGGHYGTELLFNEFLLNFGMSLQEPEGSRIPITNFVPHSVTTGVSELKIGDPTPIEVHTSDPLVLSTCDGWNMLVVYSKEFTVVSPNRGDTWRPRAPMPTPRADLAVAVVNERIYAIGGYDGTHTLAIMEEYDPATNTWRSRAPMPTARGWLAATSMNGKIYVIGGWDGTKYLPTVEEYDPATDTWRLRADMPTHRYGLAVVAIGGRIYAIGGQNEIGAGYLTTVEEYNPATDTWRPRADMVTRRYGLAAAMVHGRIYALGGYNVIDGPQATVEEYDPIHNTWRRVADMPTAQISLAAGTVGGRLYAIGGFETYPSPMEEYDPLTNTWESRTPLPTTRAGLAAAVVRGRLYAIGGYDGNRRLGTVEEYDPPFYDTDGDGFADDEELCYGRDPLVPEKDIDTDGDGLLDLAEVTKYGTNPWVPDTEADTDGDGLANVAEVDRYGTNATVADTDRDGLGDGAEVLTYKTNPLVTDTDGDDLTDGEEVTTYGTNPTVADTDGDGLIDGEEVLTYKTDPLVADTDGDEFSDGAEVTAGTNPLDPAEHPSTTTGTATDTATTDTPAAFIPGFTLVELLLALACLVVLTRRKTKQ